MEAKNGCGSARSVSAAALLVAGLAGPVAGQTERVSIDSAGVGGSGASQSPSISADGRYVAFHSSASDLVSGDTNLDYDVFVRDRQNGTTERVSVDSLGTEGDSASFYASISADGRYVVFHGLATNLVGGDTNGTFDVFVHDRQSGATERVSLDSLGAEGNDRSSFPSVSADGRYVAFESEATNLASGDANGTLDIFVHDRQSGTTECVSVDALGVPGNDASQTASISADGRYVVFESFASDLVSGDTNGRPDVFVRDHLLGVTERVSVDSSGAEGNSNSERGSISPDGRYVAFDSFASNLVGSDSNGHFDVFVRDRHLGVTERVSLGAGGAEGNSASQQASVSADGRFVVFDSFASNLVGGDTNGRADAFIRDRLLGVTERVSVNSAGAQGNGESSAPSVSADGRDVAFQSQAGNLVGGDTNGNWDVFVRDRCVSATAAVYSGDGINADTITPVSAVLGSSWSAPLTLGHPHGTGGPLALMVRRVAINGPNFASPIGGRPAEVLTGGPLLFTLRGSHDGASGDVPPQSIPDSFSLVSAPWAAQYVVLGGGFGDLSQAVIGTIGCR